MRVLIIGMMQQKTENSTKYTKYMSQVQFNEKEDIYLSDNLIKEYPHLKIHNNYQNFNLFSLKLISLLEDLKEDEYWGSSDDYFNSLSIRGMLEKLKQVTNPYHSSYDKLDRLLSYFDEQIKELTHDGGKVYYKFKFDNLSWLSSRIPNNSPSNFV